jgi:TRAP-type uncharacterized transport system substrate-binding protein
MKHKKHTKVFSRVVGVSIVVVFALFPAASTFAEDKMAIEIMAGRPNDPWTVLTYALSGFINHDSERLVTNVLPTGGIGDPVKILIAEPKRRLRSTGIGYLSGSYVVREKKGLYPLFFGLMATSTYTWITYDKNIKTLKDFAGKVVAGPRKNPGWWESWAIPLENAGVLDKVKKLTAGGAGGALSALIDGKADVAWTVVDAVYPDVIKPSSFMEQARVRGELFFPDWGKGWEVRAAEKLNRPLKAVEVPPKSLSPTQKDTIYIFGDPTWWGAAKEMDEEIVYEITKILYEHAKKKDFAKFHFQGRGIVPESVPYCVWKDRKDIEEWYHPGALKFYREIGVPGL